MSQDFPDQPYLERIKAALWRRGLHGHAAVMVGSGFSLNAKPRSASSGSFPTWDGLAKTVVGRLYPTHGSYHERALKQAKGTSGFLRLAQEYEAAYGREALERLIGEAVPDRQFEPGDLHELLLELPWADVFTTNWDTLLERAADRVIDRKYDVIRQVADIPASIKPRIVKLHGTLATNRPFVFTEEDFRRYPIEQAPFVNLAQQAMMENVFCLLGFSGDDPNFLYWSGWVRDHLGPYTPQIYLIGWLDLPPPRRRMLEERGVIPIDCARLSVPWPEELRHQYAVEWFLWNLKVGEPYRLNNWPSVRSRRTRPVPAYLEISADGLREPRQESLSSYSSPTVEMLKDQFKIWRYNRELYPGWLIAPNSARISVWVKTKTWIPEILRLLPALSDVEKLECLDELNWRLEVCLVPLIGGLPEAFKEVLVRVDSLHQIELRRRWLNLAVALLRHAREKEDLSEFEHWFAILTPNLPIWPELRLRLRYERCLLALAQLDHQEVARQLAEWDVSSADTFWSIRKAGLLAESGRTEEAFLLTRTALSEIRQRTRKDVVDVPSLSREGWAMVLAQGFDFYPLGSWDPRESKSESLPRGIEEGERAEKRWEVLRVHGCDAWESIYEFGQVLQGDPPKVESEEIETFGFDPGYRTRKVPWFRSEAGSERNLPALQARRLIEEVGLPPVAHRVDIAKKLLLRIAVWLEEQVPHEALGLVLRACTYEGDDTFNLLLTRNRIALLENDRVAGLVGQVEKALAHGIPKATAALVEKDDERLIYWLGRIRVAVELLSRLALRLDGDKAERILQMALDYYGQSLFQQHHWLVEPLANLFFRVLTVLEPRRAQKYIAQFVDLPIPGEKDFDTNDNGDWPNPLAMVGGMKLAEPIVALSPTAIRRLIELVGISPSPYPRKYAVRRLSVILEWGMLTEEEKNLFGEALWRHRLPPSGFPEGTSLYDVAFLNLPEPQQGLAWQVFREKYLQDSVKHRRYFSEDYLRNIAGAVRLAKKGGNFCFAIDEIEKVARTILDWWRKGGVEEASIGDFGRSSFDRDDFQEALVEALGQAVLPLLPVDSPLVNDVSAMVEDLRTACFPVEHAYPALTRLQPERLPEYADRLRQSLASGQRSTAEAAVGAVRWWLGEGLEFDLSEPPVDLVREIALAISLRRSSCLKQALIAGEWILLHRLDLVGQRFVDLVAEGLGYLLGAVRYDARSSELVDSGFAAEETSWVRALCAKVAWAATRGGNEGHPVFEEWIRQAQTDPLPEVRHALTEVAETGYSNPELRS